MESPAADEESQPEQRYSDEKPEEMDKQPLEVQDAPEQLSKFGIFLLNISWFGLSFMFLILTVVVVPSQIESMVGTASKGRWLGGMVAGGAVMMFVAGPLIGMYSDRSTSRFGRRRPVMCAATLFLCLGLFGMAFTAPEITDGRNFMVNGTENCDIDLVTRRCQAYVNVTELYLHAGEGSALGAGMPPHPVIGSHDDTGQRLPPTLPPNVEVELTGNIGLYVVFYLLVAIGFAGVTVAYDTLIADKSHPSQRGLCSGMMGFMYLMGNICGATLGLFFLELGVLGTYMCVSAILVLCILCTVVTTTESAGKGISEPLGVLHVFIGFWDPLKEHDFMWVFITRLLMQQGVSTVVGFLEYYLSDMVYIPNCWTPARAVAIVLMPLLGTAAITSIVSGILSDRCGKRKPFVTGSAAMMFVVALAFAFVQGQYGFYIAIVLSFFFGVGFGTFQAVDFALVMDVLPEEKDKAKDIACWNQALILPGALATPIGGVILDVFEKVDCQIGLGYIILFLVTAIYFLLSAGFVHKIRGVS